MAMKKKFDAVYSEKYTDREGNEKTRYTNLGSLLERDDGSLTLKLESLPIGFTGWVNFYEPKAREEGGKGEGGSAAPARPQRQAAAPAPAADDLPGFQDDDIPF